MAKHILPEATTCVLYLRMSDERQEHSIADQHAELLKYAEKHGYKVLREYADPAISGDDTLRRVEFLRMREDASKGEFSVVLCWDQDRFGRFDPIEGGYWILPFRNAGVRLETIAQGRIDWTDFGGRLRYVVEQEGKHAYLRDLSRNVCRGMARAAKEGSLVIACYGYRLIDGELVVEPEEAKAVKMVFRLYLAAKGSLRSVAVRLNEDGIPSPNGGSWSVNSVRSVLRRHKYTGGYSWGERAGGRYHGIIDGEIVLRQKGDKKQETAPITNDKRHPAIVTEEQFSRVQQLLARRSIATSPSTRTYLLSGLLRCKDCGSAMVGKIDGRKPSYHCSGYDQSGKAFCSHNRIDEASLVETIIRLIEKNYLSEAKLNGLRQEYRRQSTQTQPDRDQDADTLRKRIKAVEKQIETGTERVFTAPTSLVPNLYTKLDQYKAEKDRLQAQLDATATPGKAFKLVLEEKVEAIVAAIRELRKAIRESKPEDVQELLRDIVGSVELSFDREQHGKYTMSKFREGTIKVLPDNLPTCSQGLAQFQARFLGHLRESKRESRMRSGDIPLVAPLRKG